MALVAGPVKSPSGLVRLGTGRSQAYVINNVADSQLATFLFMTKSIPRWNGIKIQIAEKAFEAQGKKFNAGSVIIKAADAAQSDYLDGFFTGLGDAEDGEISACAVPAVPDVAVHDLVIPARRRDAHLAEHPDRRLGPDRPGRLQDPL